MGIVSQNNIDNYRYNLIEARLNKLWKLSKTSKSLTTYNEFVNYIESLDPTSTLAFNAEGELTTKTLVTGTKTVVFTYGYHTDGRLLTITLSGDVDSGIPITKNLNYDANNEFIGTSIS